MCINMPFIVSMWMKNLTLHFELQGHVFTSMVKPAIQCMRNLPSSTYRNSLKSIQIDIVLNENSPLNAGKHELLGQSKLYSIYIKLYVSL